MRLRIAARPQVVQSDPVDFLAGLSGPTAFVIDGADNSRCRGVVTLLHGNEPSGLVGLHRWLRDAEVPAVRTVCVVASVDAAMAEPRLSHRMLPGHRDLNRCFQPPFADLEGELASDILGLLNQHSCEAIVDLHNNSGHNPPYGVVVEPSPERLALVSYFTDSCVHTNIYLGTLMEAFESVPCVTIECGRAGDPEADNVAFLGLQRFLQVPQLNLCEPPPRSVRLYIEPLRVTLAPGKTVAFADSPVPTVDVTLSHQIDRLNFQYLRPSTDIGWLAADVGLPLRTCAADGVDLSAEYFENSAGVLRTRRALIPIMMTTNSRIAASDCLFYIVQERDYLPGSEITNSAI